MVDLNRENLTELAEQAIAEGGHGCTVDDVFQPQLKSTVWCIKFTNDYGQFCRGYYETDSGHEHPLAIVKPLIARYLDEAKQLLNKYPSES
jgi:hypothetical protein